MIVFGIKRTVVCTLLVRNLCLRYECILTFGTSKVHLLMLKLQFISKIISKMIALQWSGYNLLYNGHDTISIIKSCLLGYINVSWQP